MSLITPIFSKDCSFYSHQKHVFVAPLVINSLLLFLLSFYNVYWNRWKHWVELNNIRQSDRCHTCLLCLEPVAVKNRACATKHFSWKGLYMPLVANEIPTPIPSDFSNINLLFQERGKFSRNNLWPFFSTDDSSLL